MLIFQGVNFKRRSPLDETHEPMTDPWEERYIYLHENHKNQRNVGQYIIHGSYGKLVQLFVSCRKLQEYPGYNPATMNHFSVENRMSPRTVSFTIISHLPMKHD